MSWSTEERERNSYSMKKIIITMIMIILFCKKNLLVLVLVEEQQVGAAIFLENCFYFYLIDVYVHTLVLSKRY